VTRDLGDYCRWINLLQAFQYNLSLAQSQQK
jgi:hypothetical protein